MEIKAILRLGLMLVGAAIAFSCMGNVEKTIKPPTSFTSTDMAANNRDSISRQENNLSETVYVCKSAGAKKYHYKQTCRGLSGCKHEVVKMDKSDAENRGLGLCGWED
jgi:hypothetical protein